jgi:hypothetical protein
MTLDGSSFVAALVISSVGFVAFSYGKSQRRLPQMLAGMTLLVFPYFVNGLLPMLGIFALVVGLMGLALRLGY